MKGIATAQVRCLHGERDSTLRFQPGEIVTGSRGREYIVAGDGSLRRLDKLRLADPQMKLSTGSNGPR